ncbi:MULTISPECIES: hypothetical protein [Shewanella]|uniref:hypothetical protein n=1 Tax=Shewanella TaxID=22 RepID=UPI001BC2F64D|nr:MULTISPECIES: hypothetical protein [Shewanella]GIU50711.1 hypothetical protein TUM4249_12420 [Shewanella sp. KT0246]
MNIRLKPASVKLLLCIVSLLLANSAFADVRMLIATKAERSAVSSANSAYYDAFKNKADENWVYQLMDDNLLEPKCYVSKTESFAVGDRYEHKNIQLQCIQIGKSTRIFWPVRWVKHCEQVNPNFGMCAMDNIQNERK